MECIGDEPFTSEQIAKWSDELKTCARWDLGCLIFDTVAIIPADKKDSIKMVGDAMCRQFGGDSSTYAAVESFNLCLKSHAVKLIDIDCNTSEDNWGKYS